MTTGLNRRHSKKLIRALFLITLIGFGAEIEAAVVFRDNFEYAVDRNAAGSGSIFLSSGRWAGVKTVQDGEPGARGYLYTSTSIPGSTASFPGTQSSRVLVLESRAGSTGLQTDFFLQTENIPGNVWIQFWIYPNRTGSQMTEFHGREKFLYPCNGDYPCNTNKWLWLLAKGSYAPLNAGPAPAGDAYMVSRDNTVGFVNNANAPSGEENKLGMTSVSERIRANRWTLVKIHYDTSGPRGSYEAWLRPQGGSWVKVAEWIDGVTPNFSWSIPVEHQGGHRHLRMPTTMPANNVPGQYDAWIYMDDFVIATSESDLPVYNDSQSSGPPLAPPTNLRLAP